MTTQAAVAHGGHAVHQEGMSRGMAGMVFFIASEVMLFGGLFAGFFYVRSQATDWPPAGEHKLGVPLAVLLSAVLISSSVTAHFGFHALKTRGDVKTFRTMLIITIVLGTAFISGQIYEWLELMHEGLTADSSVYGSTFYVITGFHGAHVIAGLAMLVVVLTRAFWNDFTRTRHLFADTAILYWHFVDFVWIFVFSILYILAPL
jgi:cytochrome c oxidase subunit 3